MKERTRRAGLDPDWPWFKHLSGHERLELRAGVYRLIHAATGCYYIGSTTDIHRRITKHLSELRHGRGLPKRMIECFQQSSRFDLQFVEFERSGDLDLLKVKLKTAETELLQKHKDDPLFLNFAIDAFGAFKGRKQSPEHTAKIVAKLKTRVISEERRAILAEQMRFYARDPVATAKRAAKLRGQKRSLEVREAMSRSRKGRKLSDEHKQLLSDMFKGRDLGPEWRARLSASKKGKKLSQESREKLRKKMEESGAIDRIRRIGALSSRPVEINGVRYPSVKAALKGERIGTIKMDKRLKSPDYPNYRYLDTD